MTPELVEGSPRPAEPTTIPEPVEGTPTLYGVGVGPGDPELLTLKAARLVRGATVIAYHCAPGKPSNARSVVADLVPADATEERLEYPVTTGSTDHPGGYEGALAEFYEECAARLASHLEAGRDVVLLAEGDPLLYSSFMYLHDRLAGRFGVEIVPGVPAFAAATATTATALVRQEDVLTVLPGTLPEPELARRLADTDGAVIMKLGRTFPAVRRALHAAGRLDGALYVERASMPAERWLPVAEVDEASVPYFSLIVVPGDAKNGVRSRSLRSPSLSRGPVGHLTQDRSPSLSRGASGHLTQDRSPSLSRGASGHLTQDRSPSLSRGASGHLTQDRSPSLSRGASGHLTQDRSPSLSRGASGQPTAGSPAELLVLGLGPGPERWTTPEVTEALASVDHVIGYAPYVNRVPQRAGLTRHASGNTVEVDRARHALELALAGERVAVVSGGDAGVFGMASAVFEAAEDERFASVPIRVLPGVSAVQAVAARAGAPVGADFAVVSLSDRLKPWSVVENRLRHIARADLVLALYNPASRSRTEQIGRAREVLLEHKGAETVVIVGRDVGRAEEELRVTTLSDLDPSSIDMKCLVIVGCSGTRVSPGGVWSPRFVPEPTIPEPPHPSSEPPHTSSEPHHPSSEPHHPSSEPPHTSSEPVEEPS